MSTPLPKQQVLNPIIKSTSFGYVVENFIGHNVYTGEYSPVITRGGLPCIFPDMDSVPPNWRPYARAASQFQASYGYHMPRVVNIIKETKADGR
jgi:hypothetical protein